MRATTLAAGGLACAGAAMTIAAFAGDAPPPPPAPHRDRGAEVFAEQGCGGCHAFKPANADSVMAPDLVRALRGRTRDYVLESIVLPDAQVAQGWSPGMMPGDFGHRIAPDDLQALATFLLRGAR
ncbi:MAG TPA: c-type cytochrome [Solirubrobacter sp.]|nr:c-type cytochrome [Solirubrobacter sp.]